MAFFQDNLGKPVTDFNVAKDDGVAVASVLPYANHCTLLHPDR